MRPLRVCSFPVGTQRRAYRKESTWHRQLRKCGCTAHPRPSPGQRPRKNGLGRLFPVMRKHDEALAVGYLGARVVESAVLSLAAIVPLVVVDLSQAHVAAREPAYAASYRVAAAVAIAARGHVASLLHGLRPTGSAPVPRGGQPDHAARGTSSRWAGRDARRPSEHSLEVRGA
jgi:hypothetical protein